MSRHIVFLKHIPFFYIPSTTHGLTKLDIIRIDPFSKDFDSLSSQVLITSDAPFHVRSICTHYSVDTDTLLSDTLVAPFLSTSPQASSKIVDPPLR